MTQAQHIIFDLDGTLIDSAPAILASFETAFQTTGRRPVRPISADIIGPPLTETLQILAGTDEPATIDALAAAFKIAYDGEGYRHTTAYDGVETMLRALQARGHTLHIATNKRLHPTRLILDMLGWTPLFERIYALDMVSPRLPDKATMIGRLLAEAQIAATQAAYVGDREEDGLSAQANRLPFFAATWGYGAIEADALPPGWHHLPTPDPDLLPQP